MTMKAIFSDDGINFVDIPPTIEVFDPPDDRYLPGYRVTDNVTGDVKEVGPRLKDLNVPFSLYGLPIPITYGVRRLYGNIIWARPLRESIRKSSQGGKGGPSTKFTTYEYFADFAVSLGIPGNTDTSTDRQAIRMWANQSLIFDRRGTGMLKWPRLYHNFHPGTSDQLPDPYIESFEGVGNVPAYRDVMYVVFKDFPVSEFGNFLPSISVEIGDAVSSSYTVQNIASTDVDGSLATTDYVVDWENGEFYSIRGGEGDKSVVRTFDIESGELIGSAYVNVEGAGYDRNDPVPPNPIPQFKFVKGISGNFRSVGYIPWLNVITGKPDNLNTGEAFIMVDPFTGTVVDWVGADKLTGSALDPVGPCLPMYPQPAYIPQWYKSHPLRVWIDEYQYVTHIVIQSISSFGGDLTYLTTDGNTLLWLDGYPDFGFCTAFAEGQHRLGQTDFYALMGNAIWKAVFTENGGGWNVLYSTGKSTHSIYYNEPDNSIIIIFTDDTARKIVIDDEGAVTVSWNVNISNYQYVNQVNTHLDNIADGYLAWCTAGGVVCELDLVFGSFKEYDEASSMYRPYGGSSFCDTSRGRIAAYASTLSSGTGESDTTRSSDNMQTTLYYGRAYGGRMPLATFIRGMALYAGYTEEQIDIDGSVDDTIDGAMITNITTFKTIIQSICTAYKIDYYESAGVIHFVRKTLSGSADDFALSEIDFLRQTANSNPEEPTLMIRREEPISIPQVVQIRYIDKSMGYQLGMQVAARSQFISTNASSEQLNIDLPIIMLADEAKLLAQRCLWGAWTSRVSYSLRVGKRHAKIEPGDFGTIQWDTRLFTARVVSVTYNSDFTINVQAVNAISEDAISVTADVGNASGVDVIINVPAVVKLFPLDIPLLAETDDLAYTMGTFRFYWAMSAKPYVGWSGGSGYMGLSLKDLDQIGSTLDPALQLREINVPDAPENWQTWDEDEHFLVRVRAGDPALLSSQTSADVLEGANLYAYGAPGRWEIVAFRDVTDNGNGTYTLTGLLRGLRGTHLNMGSHKRADHMILLSNGVESTDLPNTSINQRYVYKAINFGQNLSDANQQQFVMKGLAAQCLPVSGLRIDREIGGPGDLTISWRRRSRYHGELLDGAENAPLTAGELNEYKVTIYRLPHYDQFDWNGTYWAGSDTGTAADYVEIEVVGSQLVVSAADIRAYQLYEFNGPDDFFDVGSTFSQLTSDLILGTVNEQILDLGFGEFVAFGYLDVMVQQKNASPGAPTWGPGEVQRIYIRDL